MQAPQTVPLGLFDLTEDECLVVSISRAWRRLGPTRAIAEHSIARLLKADQIYPALEALFRAFATLGDGETSSEEEFDLLSRSEHRLLDRLAVGGSTRTVTRQDDMAACRTALRRAGIELRPLGTIHRSGHDHLMARMSSSYRTFMRRHL
ncbi:MAG: hypothetical protein AAGM22_26555 [Acidobacteriota bacterium]